MVQLRMVPIVPTSGSFHEFFLGIPNSEA